MGETKEARIVKVAGPVVVAEGMTGARSMMSFAWENLT